MFFFIEFFFKTSTRILFCLFNQRLPEHFCHLHRGFIMRSRTNSKGTVSFFKLSFSSKFIELWCWCPKNNLQFVAVVSFVIWALKWVIFLKDYRATIFEIYTLNLALLFGTLRESYREVILLSSFISNMSEKQDKNSNTYRCTNTYVRIHTHTATYLQTRIYKNISYVT